MSDPAPRFRLYRLISPLVAVRRGTSQNELFTVHAGTNVLAAGEVRQSGFIDALVDGEFVCLFMRDLENCGERVDAHASSTWA